nr:hypothetical protein [Desulfobulbaceae bacterium]
MLDAPNLITSKKTEQIKTIMTKLALILALLVTPLLAFISEGFTPDKTGFPFLAEDEIVSLSPSITHNNSTLLMGTQTKHTLLETRAQ